VPAAGWLTDNCNEPVSASGVVVLLTLIRLN
jgi:hypothetical protein